jgi:hypothetical protein
MDEGFRMTHVKPVFVEYMPAPKDMVLGLLYVSLRFRMVNHICPCGCGYEVPLPLEQKTGWLYACNELKEVTLAPSILNPWCKAHYYIRNNKIVWV